MNMRTAARKIFLILFSSLSIFCWSQTGAPQLINYQGIARDAFGTIITTPIGIQFEVLQSGAPVYVETQTAIPSAAGIFTVAIGGGSVISGTFASIVWGLGSKELKVSIDPTGGTSYVPIGTSSLISVPYALYAEKTKPPLITLIGNTLTVGGTSVNLPGGNTYTAGPGISIIGNIISNTSPGITPTITGAGMSTVSVSGNSYTVNTPAPTFMGAGTTTVTGSYPSYTITSAVATGSAAGIPASYSINAPHSVVTNSVSNSTTISIVSPTITQSGIISSGGAFPNYTISAAAPILTGGGATTVTPGAYPNYTISTIPTLSVAGAVLSINGGNSVTLPTGTTYTAGTGISLAGNIITNTSPSTTLTAGNTNIALVGSAPNYTISNTPTLSLVAGTLSISNGNSVNLPLGAPQTSVTSGNTNITITGLAPNFTISNTPTLSIVANTLSISNGNSVNLPLGPPPASLTGVGITTVTNIGQSFTVTTPSPLFSAIGTTSMNGAYPNYTLNTPAQILTSNNFTLTSSHGGSAMLPSYVAGSGVSVTGPYPTFTISTVTSGTNAVWGTLGNSSTTAPLNFLGTTDAMDLVFKTAANERMRILGIGANAGYVGIGTAIPGAKLHIADVSSKVIVDATGGGASTAAIDLKSFAGGVASISKLNSTGRLVFSSGGAFNMQFTNAVGGSYQFDEGVNTRMYIATGGNIGINTMIPLNKLSIHDNVFAKANIHSYFGGNNNGGALELGFARGTEAAKSQVLAGDLIGQLEFAGYTSGATFSQGAWISAIAQEPYTAAASGTQLEFMTHDIGTNSNITKMVIAPNGNVGIGTNLPTQLLQVNSTFASPAVSLVAPAAMSSSLFFGTTANNFLGSVRYDNSTNKMDFWTNNTSQVTIDNFGNMGIGTNSPGGILHVRTAGGSYIINENLSGGTNPYGMEFRAPGQSYYILANSGTGPANSIGIYDGTASAMRMIVMPGTGNIGIGTTSPGAQLEVSQYTKLGSTAPAIQMLKLTGTTAPGQGGNVSIGHGLVDAKILSISVMVSYLGAAAWLEPGYTLNPGYEFYWFNNGAGSIVIVNMGGNSISILSKPIQILITYEQ